MSRAILPAARLFTMRLIADAVMFAVYFVGPGVMAGLAVVRPRRYLCLAIIYLMALECMLWPPNFFWQLPIGFSVALGLFCGLLCTGRQHQDKDE